MAFQWHPVPSFGGGLNLGADPLSIQDDQWTWCHGFYPEQDQAQSAGKFLRVATGGQWGYPGIGTAMVIGWVPDLIRVDYPGMLCFYTDNPTIPGSGVTGKRLYFNVTANATPNPNQLTLAQTGTGHVAPDLYSYMPPPMTTCVVAGQQLVMTGSPYNSADSGAFKYVADDKLYILNGVRGRHSCAASGHAVIAAVADDATNLRTVKISDAGKIDLWAPDISNSADFFTVDGGGQITGLVGVSGGFIVLMQRSLQVAQSTRQIPPFSLDGMQSRPALGEGTLTANGAVYVSTAGLANASGQIMSPQVASYIQATQAIHCMRDPTHDSVVVTNGLNPEFLGVNLRTDRAWRHALPFSIYGNPFPTQPVVAHGTLIMASPRPGNLGIGAPTPIVHTVMDITTGDVWWQLDDSQPEANAFVDSKDFAFGSGGQPVDSVAGAMVSYVDRLKVQWESSATGALDVWVAVRNHLGRQAGAALPWQESTAQTLNWTKVGTLTAGLSELPLRLKGKFYRFRFAVSNGQPIRIRGFAIRNLPTADLRAAA